MEALGPDPQAIVKLPVDKLLLDASNPRLASLLIQNVRQASQNSLLKVLWTQMAVDEVALSIAANGYWSTEPLFVIAEDPKQRDSDKKRFIVVEGNRRLAAVKLLLDEKLRSAIRATELPQLSEAAKQELRYLPATIYPDRESIWPYLGFRHINGPQKWDSFSKAQYVSDVYEQYNVPLEDIADKIGDRHDTVKRLYRGYVVLRQAEEQTNFDKEDSIHNRFFFSHLYTALDQSEYLKFLGLERGSSLKPNPVPTDHLEELEELMTWLYGRRSQGMPPVVQKQDPDLNTLRAVVAKEEALSVLRAGRTLERAYKVALGDKRIFRDALIKAKEVLQEAKSVVATGYDGEDELYDIADDVVKTALSLRKEMQERRDTLA